MLGNNTINIPEMTSQEALAKVFEIMSQHTPSLAEKWLGIEKYVEYYPQQLADFLTDAMQIERQLEQSIEQKDMKKTVYQRLFAIQLTALNTFPDIEPKKQTTGLVASFEQEKEIAGELEDELSKEKLGAARLIAQLRQLKQAVTILSAPDENPIQALNHRIQDCSVDMV